MNQFYKSTGDTPVKYFGHFLGPKDHLECRYPKTVWAEIAAIIYAPIYHNVLEIWCARIHAPDYLEDDTFVMDESADRVVRRAVHYVSGLDLGLMEITEQLSGEKGNRGEIQEAVQ